LIGIGFHKQPQAKLQMGKDFFNNAAVNIKLIFIPSSWLQQYSADFTMSIIISNSFMMSDGRHKHFARAMLEFQISGERRIKSTLFFWFRIWMKKTITIVVNQSHQ